METDPSFILMQVGNNGDTCLKCDFRSEEDIKRGHTPARHKS